MGYGPTLHVGRDGRTGAMWAVVEVATGQLRGFESLQPGKRFFASEREEVQGPPRVPNCSRTAEGPKQIWSTGTMISAGQGTAVGEPCARVSFNGLTDNILSLAGRE